MSTEPLFEPLEFDRLDLAEQHRRSREFLSHMLKRRSVREFSSQPVPIELIENAIRIAGSAPSGANQQPWTFVVIRDRAIKREIRIAAETEEKDSYERRMSQEWLDALAHLGTDWRKPHIEDAPYVIVVFRQAYGFARDEISGEEKRVMHYYSEESVGIAVGFLLAALHYLRSGHPDPYAKPDEIPDANLESSRQRTPLRADPGRLSSGSSQGAHDREEVFGPDSGKRLILLYM